MISCYCQECVVFLYFSRWCIHRNWQGLRQHWRWVCLGRNMVCIHHNEQTLHTRAYRCSQTHVHAHKIFQYHTLVIVLLEYLTWNWQHVLILINLNYFIGWMWLRCFYNLWPFSWYVLQYTKIFNNHGMFCSDTPEKPQSYPGRVFSQCTDLLEDSVMCDSVYWSV